MDTLNRERITTLFFRNLGIENPTTDQKNFIQPMDDCDMSRPMIMKMKEKGLTFGEISKKLGVNKSNIKNMYYKSNRKRLAKQTTNEVK